MQGLFKASIFFLIILSMPVVSLECQKETNIEDIPCDVTSTWLLDNACNTYTVDIYNVTGDLIDTTTLSAKDNSYCYFVFNETTNGTYYFNASYGDTGFINLRNDNMILGNVFNWSLIYLLGIVVALFLYYYGMNIQDQWMVNFSAILFLSMGILVLINGIYMISNLVTLALGSIFVGIGAYIGLRVNIENMEV